ncbi:MAG TPA: GrpB family protein [Mucilaginibacter sp.]|jgi:GrpB-like predicted nucleotidyltransferase (UPF0157 family)|nr:GrpB family protein [Mucilaginibacter sp.]
MKIAINDYQDAWKGLFAREQENIHKLIGFLDPVIMHIGSTSVPGLCAKPVIDIQVGLQNSRDLDRTILPMQSEYTYVNKFEPDWPTRRFYCKFKSESGSPIPKVIDINDPEPVKQGLTSLFNIHVFAKDTEDWIRHIAFRDYLIHHEEVRYEYGRLKKELSAQEFDNIIAYNYAKSDFVKKVQTDALTWYNSTR